MDEGECKRKSESFLCFNIPDGALGLNRADREQDSGGLCVYIADAKCSNTVKVSRQCCSKIELEYVQLIIIIIFSLYIHPDSKNKMHSVCMVMYV